MHVPYVSDVLEECHAVFIVVMKILAVPVVVLQNAMMSANTV